MSTKATSPYYPPRARWYAPVFYLTSPLWRWLALDRIHMPDSIKLGRLAVSFLVPGSGFYLRGGPRVWGITATAAIVLLFCVFIIWLGYPLANLAFGMLVSIHVSSIVYYCNPLLNQWEFTWRILFTVLVLIGIGFLVYTPLRNRIQSRWLLPVESDGHVVVLEKFVKANDIHRGDVIAYTLHGYRFSNHWGNGILDDRTGFSLGPVLAMPGDAVGFSSNGFSVNGVFHPSLQHMPKSGMLVVAQNHWFVWPNLAISGNWNVGEDNISAAMLQLSDVSENQLVARPFKHWFWRKQILQ